MKLIPTTAAAIEKLSARAKVITEERFLAHMQALEAAAHEAGYESWFHVQWCYKQDNNNIPDTVVDKDKLDRSFYHQYMAYLAEKALGAKIERFPARGDVFHAIEIEGQYFYSSFLGDPAVVRRSSRLRGYEMGWVQLGRVAEIHFTSRNPMHDKAEKSWFICKYSSSEAKVPNQGPVGFIESVMADQVVLSVGQGQQAGPFRSGQN